MNWTTTNLRSARHCAFCKYWWDPACTHITPKNEQIWMFDASARCLCIKRNMDTSAQSTCGMFHYKNVILDL